MQLSKKLLALVKLHYTNKCLLDLREIHIYAFKLFQNPACSYPQPSLGA